MLQLQGLVKQGNHFIKKQFQRLLEFKVKGNSTGYWNLCFHLLTESKVFFLVSLYKWNPIFYKELKLTQLVKLLKDYKESSAIKKDWPLRQLWISSPPGKPRLLTIASVAIRLFLSALNNFLLFWSNEYLGSDIIHGFFYNRGVNTYWHSLLDNKMSLLKESPFILELDLASCFKNINRTKLLEVLKTEHNLPDKVIGIIAHFTNLSVPVDSLVYPGAASYAESMHNTTPSRNNRGIFEGLPISPWLANVMIHSCFRKAGWLTNPELAVRLYA